MGYMEDLIARAEQETGKKVSFKPDVALKGSNLEGFLWLNSLIKFHLDMRCEKCGHVNSPESLKGSAEMVRSFAKPAKDSRIKSIVKPKKEQKKDEFKRKEATKPGSLF